MKGQWGREKADFFLLFMIWFLSREFDIGTESAEASKFAGLGVLFSKTLSPSCLSRRQALGVRLADPHGEAVPAPPLRSGEVPQHSYAY